jgi:hypothetical protein
LRSMLPFPRTIHLRKQEVRAAVIFRLEQPPETPERKMKCRLPCGSCSKDATGLCGCRTLKPSELV